jgi:hypothetical protein
MKKSNLLITAVLLLISIPYYTVSLDAKKVKNTAKKKKAAEIQKDDELKELKEDFNAVKEELVAAKKQIQEAKKEVDNAKSQLKEAGALAKSIKDGDIGKTLKSRLSPDKMLMGLFPNTDGFIDGKIELNRNYLGYFNSGFNVAYSAINDTSSKEGQFESSTLKKEVLARAQLFGGQIPIQMSENSFLGLKLAAGAVYSYTRSASSGYKTEQGETIYFNTKKDIHNVSPAADAEINIILSRYFSLHLTGGYLAYVFIDEQGEKKYSSYENPIKYSYRNINNGYHAEGSMILSDLPFGDIEIYGHFYNYMGEYQTDQVLITGAYLTKIKTYSTYSKRVLDIGVNYTLTFLAGYSQYIPIVSFGYTSNYEKIGDSVLFDQGVYHMGIMVKFN